MNKKIVINGKFLSQKITGVQRYAREILLELDKLLDESTDVVLLADADAKDIPKYKHIRIQRYGKLRGNLWEQISLPIYAIRHRAVCVSLCNMAPILKPDVVAIHDVSYKVNKNFFSKKFALWYNFAFSSMIRRIKTIITVSEFSKEEICRCYPYINPKRIIVTYNGWQHYARIKEDVGALKKYNLEKGEYYFSMSSMAPNKNFKWIAESARNNPEIVFAVSGAVNQKVFGDVFDFEMPQNLKFLGYVSDEEAKEITRNCRGFIFPSYYEGFGIPPLEALSVGAKAIVSDGSCMREIFGKCVYYISPNKPNIDLDKLISSPCVSPNKILEKYSWKKSAMLLLKIISK